MARAHITREGVLNAIAEFDALGREAFLERYGFNGARDYFLVLNGRQYDSKAIAAVAHKWAPGGDGEALTALGLSGGRTDAAKVLRELGFTVTEPERNADWTWDEHVLALDLYMTNPASPPGKGSAEVSDLSKLLQALGKQSGAEMSDKFRNANGIYMKMMNFRRFDPSFQSKGKVGLERGSKGEEEVWKRYGQDRAGLREAAERIKSEIQRNGDGGQGARETGIDPKAFHDAFARFLELVLENEGTQFRNFQEGVAAAWEDYKPRLRQRALELLSPQSWLEEQVGSGAILEHTIAAIEIQDPRLNLRNNLVFWQNRFGHSNRDHKLLLEARADAKLRGELEQLLFDLFRGKRSEGEIFDALSEKTSGKYPLLAYLYFLKDMERFAPIQPTTFDRAFAELSINLVTLRSCSWDNYLRYTAALAQVQRQLQGIEGLASTRLIDAHSFCWLLIKLPSKKPQKGQSSSGAGRVVGGREKSVLAMRYSIVSTTRNANGQLVERTVKNKDLRMRPEDLDAHLTYLLDLQENRCALTGIQLQFHGPDADRQLLPSADRIDSSGHYEEGNLQVVCQFINFWKRDTEVEEFKRLLRLVRDEQ